jgi:SAM-dependent methyltransferase
VNDGGATAWLDRLDSPDGRAVLAALRAETGTALQIGTRLRRTWAADLVADAQTLHALRERAAAKFSRAPEMFFTRGGWEQSSSEVVARHRAARFTGTGPVADLCCGIGGDLVALAARHPVLGVDRDPVHARIAALNARVHGVAANVTTRVADVRDVDLAGLEAVFVDPARRTSNADGAARTRDVEPPLDWCFGLAATVPGVAVKAAPGLAHDAVPDGWEREFVAVGTDLKEATLWSPAFAVAHARATVLPGGHTLLPEPGDPVAVRAPGEWLLDPSPAVTRAGLVEELARALDAAKIDDRIAFLTLDRPVTSPFARTLRVLDAFPWREKELPERLRHLDIGAVDVRRRGLAGDVDLLRKRLRLTGSRRATLVMTRVADRPWALVCVDPDSPEPAPRAAPPP